MSILILVFLGCLACLFADQVSGAESGGLKDSLITCAEQSHQSARTMAEMLKAVESWEELRSICEKEQDYECVARAANNAGSGYLNLYRPQNAIRCFEEASKGFKRLRDKAREGQVPNNMATAYHMWGYSDLAVKFSLRALAIAQSEGDQRGKANALSQLGQIHAERNDLAKAREYLEDALKLYRTLGNGTAVRQILEELAILHHKNGQDVSAIKYEEEALSVAREEHNDKWRYGSLKRLAVFYAEAGEFEKAIKTGNMSVDAATKIGGPRFRMEALVNLGNAYYLSGRCSLAEDCYEEALALARRSGDLRVEASVLNNLASLDSYRGNYGTALEYLKRVNTIARLYNEKDLRADALHNQAICYYKIAYYSKAVECNEEALDLRKRLNDHLGQYKALLSKARIYGLQGDPLSVRTILDEALKIPLDSENAFLNTKQLIANWGLDYLLSLGPENAVIGQLEALIRQEGSWATQGRLHLFKSEYATAKECYQEQLAEKAQVENSDVKFACHTGLGLAFEGLENPEVAAVHFREAKDLTEENRFGLSPAQRKEYFNYRVGGFLRTVPYEALARVLMKMNRPQEALTISEHTKARNFAEAIAGKPEASTVGVPPDVLDAGESLRDELAALKRAKQRLNQADRAGGKSLGHRIKDVKDRIRKLKLEFDNHKKMLRKKYRLFAATKYPEPMNLAHTALKDDEWVLSLDVTDPGVLIYLTKGKKLVKSVYNDVPRKVIDELVKQFRAPFEYVTRDNLYAKLEAFDFKAGKRLYDVLLSEVIAEIPEDAPLIIIPDDSLGVLPFEMLVMNEGGWVRMKDVAYPRTVGAKFFGDRNLLSYYQSITALTLARLHQKPVLCPDRVAVFADPVFGEDDPRYSRNERKREVKIDMTPPFANESSSVFRDILQSVYRAFGARTMSDGAGPVPRLPETANLATALAGQFNRRTVCLGLEACERNVREGILSASGEKRQPLKDFGTIVFATHGYTGDDLPAIREPALALTLVNQTNKYDGYLSMSEVWGLDLNADVVALTACRTGEGRRLSGEGTMNLGRAFQYAGARSALISLWKVDTRASTMFTEAFFKQRRDGKSKLEALALARRHARNQGYDHPFYWAAFILVGEVD